MLLCWCGVPNGCCWHCQSSSDCIPAWGTATRIQTNWVTAKISGIFMVKFVLTFKCISGLCAFSHVDSMLAVILLKGMKCVLANFDQCRGQLKRNVLHFVHNICTCTFISSQMVSAFYPRPLLNSYTTLVSYYTLVSHTFIFYFYLFLSLIIHIWAYSLITHIISDHVLTQSHHILFILSLFCRPFA